MIRRTMGRSALALAALLLTLPAAAEVVEEIVAWIDGDIITMSELRRAEQEMLQDLYRQYAGNELDEQLREGRQRLLRDLIDRRILLHKAERLFTDMNAVGESFLEMFQQQQNISDEELQRTLDQMGMTVEEFKRQLVERFAPSEIIRMEVGNRIAVGDPEVEAYYRENQAEFRVPASVTVREIILLAEGEQKEGRRAEAEQVRERAAAEGADFAALAQEVSDAGTKSEGGLLGPLGKGDLSPRLEELALTIPVGSVGPLLEMPYGYHILKVEERTDARVRQLDEVAESIRSKLDTRKYQEALETYLQQAREDADVRVNPKYQAYLGTDPG